MSILRQKLHRLESLAHTRHWTHLGWPLFSQEAAGTVDMLETLPPDVRQKYESALFLLKPEQKSLRL